MRGVLLLSYKNYRMSIDLKTELHVEYFNAEEKYEHTSLLPLLPNTMSRLAIVAGPVRFAQNPPRVHLPQFPCAK